MKKSARIILITLLSFALYFILDELYFRSLRSSINANLNQIGISHIITYIILGIPIFIGTLLLHQPKDFFKSLGLDKPILQGAIFSFLCTLPMFLGYGSVFEFNSNISVDRILVGVLAAAFFEELYFRGFLFGQLFRYTKLGFIPAVILGAVLFGLVHLYQGKETSEIIGIFLVTFSGGLLFAWLYAEWNYNLWVPIFLHLFMNLSWDLFNVDDSALGGNYANIFRMATIALSIILTIIYKRRRAWSMEVNRKTLLRRV